MALTCIQSCGCTVATTAVTNAGMQKFLYPPYEHSLCPKVSAGTIKGFCKINLNKNQNTFQTQAPSVHSKAGHGEVASELMLKVLHCTMYHNMSS